ncbi:MAG: type II and III secretion system protein family protein [Pseudomonadota bacterium]
MKRIILVVLPFLLAVAQAVPPAQAQSVLKVARGLQSNNVSVLIDRAIVLDSAVRFLEVSVANPEIADVSPLSDRSVYIFGRRRGTTTLTLLGENGRLITNVTIKVEADHSELKQRLRQLLPNEPIEVRTANGGLILSGVVSGKAKVDRAMSLATAYAGDAVTNMMSVGGTQQVMLKVKIAEMSRSAGKELGLSLGLRGTTGDFAPEIQTGTALTPGSATVTTVLPNGTVTTTEQPPTRPSPGGNPATDLGTGLTRVLPAAGAFAGAFGAIFNITNNFILDVQLDALEQKGFARTLAEPNLVALSGIEASFLAGGEVPVPVRGNDGEITVDFRPIGVNLNFLPQVLDDDLINLSVSAEVSDVDPSITTVTEGIEIVGFNVRRATTTVELRDGQAFAIAGLIQEDFTDTISQVPWLGDLPVLGTLFRSTNFQRGESELVIIVSAHLVTPADNESDLSLPTDRIRIPNEVNLFLLGEIHEGATTIGGISGVGFDGDFGYVVE